MSEFSTVRGTRLRVTRVDECGTPATGASDSVVTDGFVTINYSPELEERDEILLKNAGGRICVNDTTAPELKWYDLEMEFCKVNPDLFALLTGQTVVEDFDMNSVGVSIGTTVPEDGFALEVWAEVPGQACADGAVPYGYFLIPWAGEGIFSDFTIENDALTFTITARSFNQHAWGQGQYDVVAQDSDNTAGPLLDPLDPDKHLHIQKTTIAPPALPS
jgi:hypothetical protein